MYIIYLIVGLILLYFGAEYLVKGSSSIAYSFGMKKIVVGLTVVALGTSMPEFVVSLKGALSGADSVSIGNIVGSNLANILLVLGITCIINPISASRRTIIFDMPVLIVMTTLFILFCIDGNLVGWESSIMLLLFSLYMGYQIINRKDKSINQDDLEDMDKGHLLHLLKNAIYSIGGIIGLVIGGNLTVIGAVELAQILGISNLIIGLTVVAIGTSLPELFTSVIASIRHEHEISIGNVIGSNLFNISFVLGVVPLISPLKISPKIIAFDNWFMLGITILLFLIIFVRKGISRLNGGILLLLYLFFILNLIFNFI